MSMKPRCDLTRQIAHRLQAGSTLLPVLSSVRSSVPCAETVFGVREIRRLSGRFCATVVCLEARAWKKLLCRPDAVMFYLCQTRIHEEQSLFEAIVKAQKGEATPAADLGLTKLLVCGGRF